MTRRQLAPAVYSKQIMDTAAVVRVMPQGGYMVTLESTSQPGHTLRRRSTTYVNIDDAIAEAQRLLQPYVDADKA